MEQHRESETPSVTSMRSSVLLHGETMREATTDEDFDRWLEDELSFVSSSLSSRAVPCEPRYLATGRRGPIAMLLPAPARSKLLSAFAAATLIGSSTVVAAAAATGSASPEVWGQQVRAVVDACKSELSTGEYRLGTCVGAFTVTRGADEQALHHGSVGTGEPAPQRTGQHEDPTSAGHTPASNVSGALRDSEYVPVIAQSASLGQPSDEALPTIDETGEAHSDAASDRAPATTSDRPDASSLGASPASSQSGQNVPAGVRDSAAGSAVPPTAPASTTPSNQHGSSISSGAQNGDTRGATVSSQARANQPRNPSSSASGQPSTPAGSQPASSIGQAEKDSSAVAQSAQEQGAAVSSSAQAGSGGPQNGAVPPFAQAGQAQGSAVSTAAQSSAGAGNSNAAQTKRTGNSTAAQPGSGAANANAIQSGSGAANSNATQSASGAANSNATQSASGAANSNATQSASGAANSNGTQSASGAANSNAPQTNGAANSTAAQPGATSAAAGSQSNSKASSR
jgi:trimeric autotransporter adhesin